MEIRNQFLKMPIYDNISKEPSSNYEMGTSGLIHSSKLQLILDYLSIENKTISDLRHEFEGHALFEVLDIWSKVEIADFVRHVLISNKDQIGWDVAESYINKLDKKYTPQWKKPNYDFNNYFENVFATIIIWEFSSDIEDCFKKIKKIQYGTSEVILDLINKLHENKYVWSLEELWILYDYLIENKGKVFDDISNFEHLTKQIYLIFKNNLNSKEFVLQHKIVVSILFLSSYLKLGKSELIETQNIIDNLLHQSNSLDFQEQISYKYLMGSIYSLIIKRLFELNIDYLRRVNLIDLLISDFIVPEQLNLDIWFEGLIQEDIHPLALDRIIAGYSSVIFVLEKFSNELPSGLQKEKITNYLFKMIKTMKNVTLDILQINDQDLEEDDFINKVVVKLTSSNIHPHLQLTIQKTYISTIHSMIYIKPLYDESIPDILILLAKKFISMCYSKGLGFLYTIDMDLRLKQYNFADILNQISKEIDIEDTLILSKTFENEIMAKISSGLEYLLYSKEDNFIQEGYEIIEYFTIEWINQFKSLEEQYYSALMMLSPVINMVLIQLTKHYYENNFPKKAFLTFLNLNVLIEIVTQEMKKSQSWKYNAAIPLDNEIMSKYNKYIENWQIEDLINTSTLQNIVYNIEDKFKTTKFEGNAISKIDMFGNEIINGYLDIVEKVERFISSKYYMESSDNIIEKLYETKLYDKPDLDSINRLDHVGSHYTNGDNKPLPFPIFRNIHSVSIATSIFNLKIENTEQLISESVTSGEYQKLIKSNIEK